MHRQFGGIENANAEQHFDRDSAVLSSLRSAGSAHLVFRSRETQTRVERAYQAGCLRLRFPRTENRGDAPCAVLINTAGGVAGGDRLDQQIDWKAGTTATVTTQAAEKIYRAIAATSRISTQLTVAKGASAEWLPQETILFDGCRLKREAKIILDEDVTFLGVEALVLGRAAMGETVRRAMLRDRMRIWRGGKLVYADALALNGDVDTLMRRAAVGHGARSLAVLVHASSEAQSLLNPVRDVLNAAQGRVAASCWNGLLAVRLLAPDGETLRHDIAAALSVLRQGQPLPRVWRC